MLKPLFLLLACFILFQNTSAQKKYINRKVAQKNYNGYMLMLENKHDSALILFNRALDDDAEAFFIYQNRAVCKLHLKDTLGAISDYRTNIKMEPDNTESKYALGNIYKHLKDSINALKFFIPAIEQANDEFSQKKLLYMNNFAGHYFRLHEVYDSALIFYSRVKFYIPQNPSTYINSAVCYFHLDSLERFCTDLEQAFILGGDVNCIALKSYCRGCNHLLEERGDTDTLSMALDTRLAGIIPNTVYSPASSPNYSVPTFQDNSRKVKVYFNKIWQICLPDKAMYYREAFWAKRRNFFGGQFTDYYIDGKIYANGTLDKDKLIGSYKVYYPNGNPKLKGQFINGNPAGKWTFYLEDGAPDLEVNFNFDVFELTVVNKSNPNFSINSGSGKFKILLDKWDEMEFILEGEFLNHNREGQWAYYQNGEKIISEKYKKGKFRNGYVKTNSGNVNRANSYIDASIFIPPQLTQVAGLYFTSLDAANYYSFIKIMGL